MSGYLATSRLAVDPDFVARIVTVLVKEKDPDPVRTAALIAPAVAASPGFADSYVWGDKAAGVEPGQGAITDAQLLSAVASVTTQG